ncbi:MAG: hypothetical protein R6W82_05885 [bacterium]
MKRSAASRHRGAALFAVVFLLMTAAPALAQSPIPIRYSTRSLSMGGATLLSASPIEMGYFNPGGLSLTGGFHIYIPMVQVATNRTLLDMIDYVETHSDNFEDWGNNHASDIAFATQTANEFGDRWVNLDLDPMIGIQMGKFSLSAYSVTRAKTALHVPQPYGVDKPKLQLYGTNDLVLNGGLGMQLLPILHAGVGVRYMQRQYTGIMSFDPEQFNSEADLIGEINDNLSDPESGFSVDAGATVTLTKALAVGGVVRGLVSSMEGADWEPEVAAGVRLKPLELLMGIPTFIIRDITVEADLLDITNVRGEEFIGDLDKFLLGAEVKLPLGLSARAGMYQGSFSYGASLHFLVVDVGVAFTDRPSFNPSTHELEEEETFVVSVGIGW